MAPGRRSAVRRLGWLEWPILVGRPGRPGRPGRRVDRSVAVADVSLGGLRRPAAVVSTALLWSMVLFGSVISVVGAMWAERSTGEAPGTFGVEAGAALWFGGAVALSVRGATTVRRAVLVLATGAVGAMLVVTAWWQGWTGAALTLAMEFGVGAVALVVVDVIVLGTLHPGLERLGRAEHVVHLQVRWSWPPLHVGTARDEGMTIELFNPDGIPKPDAYRQVAVATGSRLVFLAGQVARTADGEPVGAGDLAAQVEQVYVNIAAALAGVGGSFADVAKLNLYVVDWQPDKMGAIGAGIGRAAARLGIDPVKPATLIGVASLAEPDLLIEVEATAVLD